MPTMLRTSGIPVSMSLDAALVDSEKVELAVHRPDETLAVWEDFFASGGIHYTPLEWSPCITLRCPVYRIGPFEKTSAGDYVLPVADPEHHPQAKGAYFRFECDGNGSHVPQLTDTTFDCLMIRENRGIVVRHEGDGVARRLGTFSIAAITYPPDNFAKSWSSSETIANPERYFGVPEVKSTRLA